MSASGRPFLDRFPHQRRSLVANLFLRGVRDGQTTADGVLAAVRAELGRRRGQAVEWGHPDALAKAGEILAALVAHPDEAAQLADWALAWEALPRHEREAIKEARAEEGRQSWMSAQPPTARQIAYLRALNHQGDVPDRLTASRLIDQLVARSAS